MTEKRRPNANVPGKTSKVTSTNMIQTKQDAAPLAMHDLLGDKLKAYYNEVVNQPVPDRFDELLRRLEARSSPKKPD
jgi:Anti-sigma factor NepR